MTILSPVQSVSSTVLPGPWLRKRWGNEIGTAVACLMRPEHLSARLLLASLSAAGRRFTMATAGTLQTNRTKHCKQNLCVGKPCWQMCFAHQPVQTIANLSACHAAKALLFVLRVWGNRGA